MTAHKRLCDGGVGAGIDIDDDDDESDDDDDSSVVRMNIQVFATTRRQKVCRELTTECFPPLHEEQTLKNR